MRELTRPFPPRGRLCPFRRYRWFWAVFWAHRRFYTFIDRIQKRLLVR